MLISGKSLYNFARGLCVAHLTLNIVVYSRYRDIWQTYDKVVFGLAIAANVAWIIGFFTDPIYAVQLYTASHILNIITSLMFIVTAVRARDLDKHPGDLDTILPLWAFVCMGVIIQVYGLLPGTFFFQLFFCVALVGGFFIGKAV